MRALQGRGPARGGRAGGGGAVGGRFRAVGGRAGGAVRPGCGGAAASGSAGGSRICGDGLTLRRPAVAAELYAAAELSRNGCTGGIVERRPRANRAVAPGRSRAVDARATARSVGRTGRLGERSGEHTSELQSPLHLVCRLL